MNINPSEVEVLRGVIADLRARLSEAEAALARVRALCDSNAGVATRDGALMVSTIRKALTEPKP